MPKQPLKGPREHPKQAKDSPTTLPRPSSAARSEQTRPKRVPRRIWRPSSVDLEAPKSSQEPPKSSQKEFERAPKRFQNNLWIENADFSKMLRFHEENQGFIQPMCEACVERIKINPDIYVFSVYSLELKELNTPEEENGD